MVTVPIDITGGTYKHKSLPLSAQITQNLWPQRQQSAGTKNQFILESFHGLKLFGTATGSKDRGMLEHQGTLYKITDTTLYSVDSDGVHTSLGTIPGVARCIMNGILTNVVITTAGSAYQWDGATVTEITDGDLETPDSNAHLNNQILFDGDGGRFVSSDVGDATSINALNFATAESNADNLLRVYEFDQLIYMFGDKTVETWWNSGIGSPPFDRVEGGILPVGLGALHSVANNIDLLYFLDHKRQIRAVTGSTSRIVATQAISREISKYSTVSDAHGVAYNLDDQEFYELTFPTANRTWVFPQGGEWFQRSSGTEGGKTIVSSYAFAHGKHLVGDSSSGNVYEMDPDTFDENGAPFVRIRDTAPIHAGLVGSPGKGLEMNRFELIMGTGEGLISGQGSDPVVMLSMSDDGGRTFDTEMWATVGKLGQYQWKVEWHGLGSFDDARIMRIKTSDPIYYSFHGAAADLEVKI